MRSLWLAVAGLTLSTFLLFLAANIFYARALETPNDSPTGMTRLDSNTNLNTVNTTRIGSDDPIETAVAVAQIVYPVTETENTPGAVILARPDDLASSIQAVSRVSHFPVNAPMLYVEEDSIPDLTRNELLRLQPEGVPVDGNTQVYVVGDIDASVVEDVRALGFETRTFITDDPLELSEMLDDWTSTQHGDHGNMVVVVNLDRLELGIPSAFWNAHAGDGLVFVTDEGIPETTLDILDRRASGPWLYLFGDETVISNETARALGQIGHVTRMPRNDLPAISAFFAGHHDSGEDWGWWIDDNPRAFGWGNAEAGRNAIFINASGPGGWANALAATTLSHMGKHAPALVVNSTGVPDSVATYLALLKPYPTAPQEQLLDHGWIIGGEATIDWQTQAELDLMLEGHLTAEPAVP